MLLLLSHLLYLTAYQVIPSVEQTLDRIKRGKFQVDKRKKNRGDIYDLVSITRCLSFVPLGGTDGSPTAKMAISLWVSFAVEHVFPLSDPDSDPT